MKIITTEKVTLKTIELPVSDGNQKEDVSE